jgi:hypothetical protein
MTKAKTDRTAEVGYGTRDWVDRQLLLKDFSKKELKNFLPGTMGMHEAMHMASVFCSVVDDQLRCHPAVLQDHQAFTLANMAHEALFDLYQRLGELHLRDDTPGTVARPPRKRNG